MDPELRAAFDALRNALANRQGRRLAFLQLLYSDSTSDLVSVPLPPPADRQAASLADQILSVLDASDRPLKAISIARRLDRANSGHFRETLSGLVAAGRVSEHPGFTYWVPGRTPPAGSD